MIASLGVVLLAAVVGLTTKAVVLLGPPDKAVLKLEAGKEVPVALSWEAVPGASTYRVQVASFPTFAPSISTRTTTETSESLPDLAEGLYFWRVAPLNAAGKSMCAPSVASFTVKYRTR